MYRGRRVWGILILSLRDVKLFDRVGSGENETAGKTAQNIGAPSFVKRFKSFISDDYGVGGNDPGIMLPGARRHHHSATNGVGRIRHYRRQNCYAIAKSKTYVNVLYSILNFFLYKPFHKSNIHSMFSQNWLYWVVKAEINSPVNKNAVHGKGVPAIETTNPIRPPYFSINIDDSFIFPVSIFVSYVRSQSLSGEIQRIYY